MQSKKFNRVTIAAFMLAAGAALPAAAQTALTTAFTYQGELSNGPSPAAGTFDMQFRVYDAATGGAQVGSTLCADNLTVSAGKFTVSLDFGAVFTGQKRFLEIEARADTGLGCANTTGYVLLSPRQELTAAPNSTFAVTAGDAATLGGQPPAFYMNAANLSGTIADARLSTNIPTLGGNQTFSGVLGFTNPGSTFSGIFTGSGAGLTGLNASNIATGTIANARTTGATANTFNTLVLRNGIGDFSAGTITANLVGNATTATTATNATNATNAANATQLGGQPASFYTNASNLNTGIVPLARLSGVPLLAGANNYSAFNGFGASTDFYGGIRVFENSTVSANKTIEFGSGIAGKQADAGKIGYGTFTPDALNIVGAGTSGTDRKVIVYAEGGTTFTGRVSATTIEIRGGADITEGFDSQTQVIEPGTLMVIDPEHAGQLMPSTAAYDSKVAGIVSGAGGVSAGIKMGQDSLMDGKHAVAMTGRVYVKCSTSGGAIKPGDLLTTSDIAGHAMKAGDRTRAPGATIGKAMSSLDEGTGLVLVLVNLQ